MRLARDPAVSFCNAPRSSALLPLLLLGGVAALELLPHPANVSPVAAAALFGGACFRSRRAAFAASLGAFALSGLAAGVAAGDWGVAFHPLAPWVFGSFALSVLLGRLLRARRSAARVAAASIAGSLAFFAITNFAVWAQLGSYPPTLAGLAACYGAGLPYLARTLLGDLAYAGGLFGALALAERRGAAPRAEPVRG